ncbi:EAL domain-containing protein [Breoghania sp.]|uniref:putative bifunctional diguanylate cyclase/phosphodiesterase n=1 Tax=Breoghania sp. TaxID=2065378 RepID=UPI002AA65A78|nr:EAL domain-containing protein [Breoghania sp.]
MPSIFRRMRRRGLRALIWYRRRRRRSFAFRFYTTLIPAIVIVNLLVGGILAYRGVEKAHAEMEIARADLIEAVVFASGQPLNDFEYAHLERLLRNFLHPGSIEAIWITDDTGYEVARAGNPKAAGVEGLVEAPIMHRKANVTAQVGALHVAFSNVKINAVGVWVLLHSLLLTLATTVMALIITGRLTQKDVIRPLRDLTQAITRTRRDGTRHRVDYKTEGEFGFVIEGFNAMQARLDRDEQALLIINSKLRRAASVDNLTGLLNRDGFEQAAEAALNQAKADNVGVLLMFIDLDRFKSINDTFGHAVGDEVLRTVGNRLASSAPLGALVARLSGDEFVLLLTGETVAAQSPTLTKTLHREIGRALDIEGHMIRPIGSIGYVATAEDYSLSSLMMKADTAMYEMKHSAELMPAAYTSHMGTRTQARISAEQVVREGFFGEHFALVVQPIVDLKSRLPVGGEVLLRLNHPVVGALSPDAFIPVAEDCGLMPELGLQVIDEALDALGVLQSVDATRHFYLSINVSSVQLSNAFLTQLRQLIARHKADTRYVVLELTESVALNADGKHGEIIRAIQDMGIRVALDDFGTGYSSLTYLKMLQPDIIKIDRSFIQAGSLSRELAGERHLRYRLGALGDAIAQICEDLNLPMVGEGIETEEELSYCLRSGIAYGQGYLFARPMSLADFVAWSCEQVAPTRHGALAEANKGCR